MSKPIPVDFELCLEDYKDYPQKLCRADGMKVATIQSIAGVMYPYKVTLINGEEGIYGSYGNFLYTAKDHEFNLRRVTPEEDAEIAITNSADDIINRIIDAFNELAKHLRESKQ